MFYMSDGRNLLSVIAIKDNSLYSAAAMHEHAILKNRVRVQFSSVAQSCPTVCDPVNCSMPGLPVHHQLPEFTQTHVQSQ